MSSNLNSDGEPANRGVANFNELPPEVISYIFEFLPFKYVKRARLVCQLWYTASLSPTIIDREEFLCVEHEGPNIPNGLVKSGRAVRHLNFMGDKVPFNHSRDHYWIDWLSFYNKEFWERFGPQLRSLSFSTCKIEKNQFLQILSYCSELRSIEISRCHLQSRVLQGCTLSCEEDDKGDCYPKLCHLERIRIDNTHKQYYDSHGKLFDHLLSSASNLKTLELVHCMDEPGIFGTEYLTPKHVFKYVQKYARSLTNICFIHSEHLNPGALLELFETPNLQLQTLETNYRFPTKIAHCLKYLQVFELNNTVNDDNVLWTDVASHLCNLRELKVNINVRRDENWFASLLPLLKNLRSLIVIFNQPSTEAAQNTDNLILQALCQEVNTTLQYLSLRGLCRLKPQTVLTLVRTHPALTEFHLYVELSIIQCWDWIIQAIFKYQVSLQCLSLTIPVVSRNALTGKRLRDLPILDENPTGHSISRLTNLWKLHFVKYLHAEEIEGFLPDNIVLPELRNLWLSGFLEIPIETIERFLINHPKITHLGLLRCIECTDETIDIIVNNLPDLEVIDISDCSNASDESIEKLKRHCKIRKTKWMRFDKLDIFGLLNRSHER